MPQFVCYDLVSSEMNILCHTLKEPSQMAKVKNEKWTFWNWPKIKRILHTQYIHNVAFDMASKRTIIYWFCCWWARNCSIAVIFSHSETLYSIISKSIDVNENQSLFPTSKQMSVNGHSLRSFSNWGVTNKAKRSKCNQKGHMTKIWPRNLSR